jgi:hypothetical protein
VDLAFSVKGFCLKLHFFSEWKEALASLLMPEDLSFFFLRKNELKRKMFLSSAGFFSINFRSVNINILK